KGDGDSYRAAVKNLRSEGVERIVSPHASLRTAFFARAIGARRKISFRTWWNGFVFTERVNRDLRLPDALRQMSLLRRDDGNLDENLEQYIKSGRAYRMEEHQLSGVPPWAKMSLRARLLEDTEAWVSLMGRIGWTKYEGLSKVLIFPGSVWATKRWTEKGYVELAKGLQKKNAQIIVMGAGNEVEIAERVAGQIPGAVSLAGVTSLYESALLLCHSDLMVGNDSASIHLASACETPLVAIFGPTILEFGFRPWSDQAYIMERKGLACRPCGPHGHHKCPKGTHECMKNLSAQEVLRVAESLLP
nr:glycosyltransferase family 9 protein [Pseudobdellovibrionaceae bacterium]